MQETSPSWNKSGADIVCMSLLRWDAEISSPAVFLAKEFSKNSRVFFIEHPFTWWDVARGRRRHAKQGRWQEAGPNLTVIRPPVVLPINFLAEGKLYNYFSRINNAILDRVLEQTMEKYHIGKYIFINFFDPYFFQYIPERTKLLKYVYQCMDDMSQVDYTKRHGLRLENDIVSTADLVLCTSKRLTALKSKYTDKARFHPNAADFDLFNAAAGNELPRPKDLEFGDRKIIGFTGSLEYRTDYGLLKKAALFHRDKIFFFVGPVAGDEYRRAGLDQLDNVVFAGARHITELPAYIQHFDCAIIPYKKNTLTASIYPLKVNEYLAAGKPVVATNFSEDIASFASCAYIAKSDEEFIRAIDTAIHENDAQKKLLRINAASGNTWKNRVDEFWRLLLP